ncbi:hypothetical protein ACFVV7_33680 [Streptomyces globisporus]|uniref:hypothetical protein n=1 Tax=Streptomyces globisporus TaxID=1908 RepID=UPI0036DB6E23
MNAPMTPDREQEIRTRELDEVTAGPWLVADDENGRPMVYAERVGGHGRTLALPLFLAGAATEADAQFVASARRSVPELLAEVERLRLRVDEVERAYIFDTAALKKQVAELEAARTKAAADRDAQVIAWLVKKAGEYRGLPRYRQEDTGDVIARLADKLSRGAVRPACPPVSPEDPHDSPLHHTYALGRDLPEVTPSSERLLSEDELKRALRGHLFGGGAS